MNPAFPDSEVHRILPPFKTPALTRPLKRAKAVDFLQSNISAINPDPVVLSSLELESQVRALRREYLREWIKGIFDRKGD